MPGERHLIVLLPDDPVVGAVEDDADLAIGKPPEMRRLLTCLDPRFKQVERFQAPAFRGFGLAFASFGGSGNASLNA